MLPESPSPRPSHMKIFFWRALQHPRYPLKLHILQHLFYCQGQEHIPCQPLTETTITIFPMFAHYRVIDTNCVITFRGNQCWPIVPYIRLVWNKAHYRTSAETGRFDDIFGMDYHALCWRMSRLLCSTEATSKCLRRRNYDANIIDFSIHVKFYDIPFSLRRRSISW